MPTVASVAARVRREGETVTFTRGSLSVSVKAFVRGYQAQDLVGDIQQGDRQLRVAPADLAAKGWPDAPARPDQVVIGGQTATVQNAETRYLRETPCLYIIQVRGG